MVTHFQVISLPLVFSRKDTSLFKDGKDNVTKRFQALKGLIYPQQREVSWEKEEKCSSENKIMAVREKTEMCVKAREKDQGQVRLCRW